MKKNFLVLSILSLLLLQLSCRFKESGSNKLQSGSYYTCPMHHQVHENKPGNCPICGMKLIRVTPGMKDTSSIDTALSYLVLPVTQTVTGTFKTVTVEKKKLQDTIIAAGVIGFDERDMHTISSRVAGRIDRLYANHNGQSITKGQPLMKIYSPQLLGAQKELLQVIIENERLLINPLKKKLVNLGMQTSEVQKVVNSGTPLPEVTIVSPYQGILRQTDDPASNSELLTIREGMYVDAGQAVFAVQGITRRWALLHIFANEIADVHVGDQVQLYLDANPKEIWSGHVDFITPFRIGDDKNTTVRVYLSHPPEDWKIGSLIHARIAASPKDSAVYVPLSSVNRLGTSNVIWVKDEHYNHLFHARQVKTGISTDDFIEVISGIEPGDQIVVNAAYMVDSDSFIQ